MFGGTSIEIPSANELRAFQFLLQNTDLIIKELEIVNKSKPKWSMFQKYKLAIQTVCKKHSPILFNEDKMDTLVDKYIKTVYDIGEDDKDVKPKFKPRRISNR